MGELHVRVVARETGAPLPGYRLSWTYDGPSYRVLGVRFDHRRPATREDGTATLLVPAGLPFVLHASANRTGFAEAQVAQAPLSPGARRDVRVEIATRADLDYHGVVRAAGTGEPIEGAAIVARPRGSRWRAGEIDDGMRAEARAWTRPDGSFDVVVPSWKELDLRVEAAGYGPAFVAADSSGDDPTNRASVFLFESSALEVGVHGARGGPPADAAGALVVEVSADPRAVRQGPSVVEPRTDANRGVTKLRWHAEIGPGGRCTLADLPANALLKVRILERGEVRYEHPSPLRLAPGERRTLDTPLGAEAVVRGRVLDPAGLPLAGCEVGLAPLAPGAEPGARPWQTRTTTTDENGAFKFDEVRPGRWQVVPRGGRGGHPGFLRSDGASDTSTSALLFDPLAVEVTSGAETPDLVLQARRGLTIRGRVEGDEDVWRDAAPGWRRSSVFASGEGGSATAILTTDGEFEVGPLHPGRFTIQARAILGPSSAPVEVAAGTTGVVLRLRPTSTIAGRVVDARGEPVDAEVSVAGPEEGRQPHRGLEVDSWFRFDRLAPGTYAVLARAGDGRIALRPDLELEEGAELEELVLRLERPARLRLAPELAPSWSCTVTASGLEIGELRPTGPVELFVPPTALDLVLTDLETGARHERAVRLAGGEDRVLAP